MQKTGLSPNKPNGSTRISTGWILHHFQICNSITSDETRVLLRLTSGFTVRINLILDPVVQSIVSLTISLRDKFVKQISAKVTNTLLFFVEKM